MNFYKRYPGDYMRDTGALTLAEHGAFSLMLDIHYSTEKPLPDGKSLYRLLRCETAAERKAVNSVVSQFWQKTTEGLINNRAYQEIDKAEKIREKNKANGSKGGRPKAEIQKPKENPLGYFSDSQKKPQQNPSAKQHQTPDTRHQKTTSPAQDKKIPLSMVNTSTGECEFLPGEAKF